MTFLEKWLAREDKINSILCAGLDPPIFEMGRQEKGLPQKTEKHTWCRRYLEAVHPFCSGVKFNTQYWKEPGDMAFLKEIYSLACEMGLVVIEDSKLADIGSSNDAGFYYSAARADAVTIAPFAGNLQEAGKQKQKRTIAAISLCLMSNPEYKREKNKLIPIDNEESSIGTKSFHAEDIITIENNHYIKQFIYLAKEAEHSGIDGVVIGAPSRGNHITLEEVQKAAGYTGPSMAVLCPGVGAQGGSAELLFRVFGKNRTIVNCGRSLMFPEGSSSTPEQQRDAAKHLNAMLNRQRQGK